MLRRKMLQLMLISGSGVIAGLPTIASASGSGGGLGGGGLRGLRGQGGGLRGLRGQGGGLRGLRGQGGGLRGGQGLGGGLGSDGPGAGAGGGAGLRQRLQSRGLGGNGDVPAGLNPDDPDAMRKFLNERIEKIKERLAQLDADEAMQADAGNDETGKDS